jgi:hypothetical protein
MPAHDYRVDAQQALVEFRLQVPNGEENCSRERDRQRIAAQHHKGHQPPGRLLAIPAGSDRFGRVLQCIASLSAIDARTWTLSRSTFKVGKRFCALLALDDEGSAILWWNPPRTTGSPRPAKADVEPLAARSEELGVRP